MCTRISARFCLVLRSVFFYQRQLSSEQRHESIEQRLSALEDRHDALELQHAALEGQVQELDRRHSALATAHDFMGRQQEEQEAALGTIQEHCRKSSADVETLQEKLEGYEEGRGVLTQQCAEVQSALHEYSKRVVKALDLQKQKQSTLDQTVADLQTSIDTQVQAIHTQIGARTDELQVFDPSRAESYS